MDRVIQGVLIAVIILGSGYLAYSFVVPLSDIPEVTAPVHDIEKIDTLIWRTYIDNDFGISFQYPPELGEVVLLQGPSGRVLGFSQNDNVIFGVYVKSTVANGRGGSILDFTGYEIVDGEYYYTSYIKDHREVIYPVEIIEIEGGAILIINNDSLTESQGYYLSEDCDETAALLNLDNKNYPGIVFINDCVYEVIGDYYEKTSNPLPLEQFKAILSTFKFIEKEPPTTLWKPSIDIFVIDVPNEWEVQQFDSGAGSADVFKSPDQDGQLGNGGNLQVNFGIAGSQILPNGGNEDGSTVGGKSAKRKIVDGITYYLIEDVYSPVKNWSVSILIKYSTTDPRISDVESILNSMVFEPSEQLLESARTIP